MLTAGYYIGLFCKAICLQWLSRFKNAEDRNIITCYYVNLNFHVGWT